MEIQPRNQLAPLNDIGVYLFSQHVEQWVQNWRSVGGAECLSARIYVPYNNERNDNPQLFDKGTTARELAEFCRKCGLRSEIKDGVQAGEQAPLVYCEIKCSEEQVLQWFKHFDETGERQGFLKFVYEIEKFKLAFEVKRVLPVDSRIPLDTNAALCVSGFYKESNEFYLLHDSDVPLRMAREIKPPFVFKASNAHVVSKRAVLEWLTDFLHQFPEDWDIPPGIEEVEAGFNKGPKIDLESRPKIFTVFDEMGISCGTDYPFGMPEGGQNDNFRFSLFDFEKLQLDQGEGKPGNVISALDRLRLQGQRRTGIE